MTPDDASALEQFIKDHDTRFVAKAVDDSPESHVLLTEPTEGKPLDPVISIEDYGARFIEGRDPGPSIRTAWEQWLAERK